MRGSERWTVLNGELLRRRCNARALLDHYLDQLVDIFDFPIATTSFSTTELAGRKSSRSRKRGSSDAYMEMESRTSSSKGSCRLKHSATAPASTTESKSSSKSSVCMRDRLRRFLHRSTQRAKADAASSTRNSLTIGLDWMDSGSSRGSALSWLSERSNPKALAATDDVTFHDCGEDDRPLQCCYASMS